VGTDAIIERCIDGRDLYVGIIGNQRLRVCPVWGPHFTNVPDDVHRIATERVKWSANAFRRFREGCCSRSCSPGSAGAPNGRDERRPEER
jgi:hypothetical protein